MATTQEEKVKKIFDDLEASYQTMRRVSRNISGLLAVGRATCDEVKAANLYMLSLYNTQKGALARLRAEGQAVPASPPFPTLFTWRGVAGQDAWKIDCAKEGLKGTDSLTGVLKAALKQPNNDTVYLSSKQVQVTTSDPGVFQPDVPSLSMVVDTAAGGQLGIPVIWLVIAGIAIAATAAIVTSLLDYLKSSNIQEETSARLRLQTSAFEQATSARLDCYTRCTAAGGSVSSCQETCAKLVATPTVGAGAGGSFFAKVGLVTVAGLMAVGLISVVRKRKKIKEAVSRFTTESPEA